MGIPWRGRAIPACTGAKPVFRTLRAWRRATSSRSSTRPAASRPTAPSICAVLGRYDWRLSTGNVWKVERLLFDIPAPADSVLSGAGHSGCGERYFAFIKANPGQQADVLRPARVDSAPGWLRGDESTVKA